MPDPRAEHCRHDRCCGCGAVRGTPEHDAECVDALIAREINGRPRLLPPRKLTRKP